MAQPSKDLQNAEFVLQSILDILIDSQEAFQQIAGELRDESLKSWLLAESLKRAEFRGRIETVLHQEGIRDIKENGTAAGAVNRVWAGLKASLGGSDRTLMATAGEIEDAACEAYDNAINADLPLPIRQYIVSQAAQVRLSQRFIKAGASPAS